MIWSLCCSTIFSENRFPLFRIMLYVRSTATTDATLLSRRSRRGIEFHEPPTRSEGDIVTR